MTSYQPSTIDNPSSSNYTAEGTEKTRREEKSKAIDRHNFNFIIQQHYDDYFNYGTEKGVRYYCPGDESQWKNACNRKFAVEEIYERECGILDDMDNYFKFRGGFLMGMDYAKSEGASLTSGTTQVNPTRFNDIAKILMGAAHIPSIKETLHDALRSFICTRLQSTEGWYPFSFITEPHYKEAQERAEELYNKLDSLPADHRHTALEYADEVSGMQGFAQEDAYMKGIIDGMEIQRLMQGTRERGEAQ